MPSNNNNNNNNNKTHSETPTPSNLNETPPYTITKQQDGKLTIVFTSGPVKGDNFQLDLPPPAENDGQSKQLEDEPSHPYSFLDGDGNEISQEEFELLSAIEIAEEETRTARESRAAQAEHRD